MITIAVLIVLLAIIALIVIILHFSLTVYVHIGGDGFSFKAKFLWFELYPRKPKKEKATSKPPKPKKTKAVKPAEKVPAEDNFDDDFDDEITDYELMHGVSQEHEDELIKQAEENKPEKKSDEKIVREKPEAEKNVKKKKQKKDKPKKDKTKKEKNSDGGLRGKIAELRSKYNKYKPYIPMAWKYFKKLLKKIRIRVDDAEISVGREDAHEAAIYYGAIQGVIANFLSMLSEAFDVKVKRLDVNCRFAENTFGGKADLSVRIKPSAVIAIAVCVAVNYLIIRFKEKNQSEKIHEEKPQTA